MRMSFEVRRGRLIGYAIVIAIVMVPHVLLFRFDIDQISRMIEHAWRGSP